MASFLTYPHQKVKQHNEWSCQFKETQLHKSNLVVFLKRQKDRELESKPINSVLVKKRKIKFNCAFYPQ